MALLRSACQTIYIALPLLLVLTGSQSQEYHALGDEHDEINRYLVQHVPNENVADNLNKARELLMHERGKKSGFNAKLVDALNVFISLDMIHSYKFCNLTGYQVLRANGITIENPYKFNRGDRVSIIIYKQFLRHAQGCRPVYRAIYQSRRAQIAGTDLSMRLDVLTDSFISCSGANPIDQLQYISILEKINLDDELVTCVALRLFSIATTDLPLRSIQEVPKLSQFALIAMYQPCEQFVRGFYDIFVPDLLDTIVLPRVMYEEMGISFNYGASQFRICYILMERSEEARFATRMDLASGTHPRL